MYSLGGEGRGGEGRKSILFVCFRNILTIMNDPLVSIRSIRQAVYI